MPTIKISIINKIARLTSSAGIVCGNSDYVVVFSFDAEWDAYEQKTARFINGTDYSDIIFSGNAVAVPIVHRGRMLSVGVFAGNLRTSTSANIPCISSVTSSDGSPAAPAPDVYAQIMEKLNDIGTVSPEDIEQAVEDYLKEHPVEENDPTVPAWAKAKEKPTYTAEEVGAVAKSELAQAIDEALAKAKASGDFDGADGHTPVKGVDYWTASDKAEVVAEATAAVDLTPYAKKTEVPTKTSQLTNDSGFLTSHQSLAAYRTAAAQDEIDSGKVDKESGKGLSTNDYTAAAKAKVDAIPANPKYTDTVYDDTALKERVATIEGKESGWDAKSDFSGSYNDLTDKPTIPSEVTPLIGTTDELTPSQVQDAVLAGRPVAVQYTDSEYGVLKFTNFNIAASHKLLASVSIIKLLSGSWVVYALYGYTLTQQWDPGVTVMATTPQVNDIIATVNTISTRVSTIENAGYLTLETLPKYGGESE